MQLLMYTCVCNELAIIITCNWYLLGLHICGRNCPRSSGSNTLVGTLPPLVLYTADHWGECSLTFNLSSCHVDLLLSAHTEDCRRIATGT